MNFLFPASMEPSEFPRLGGKGGALARLGDLGFEVPPWFAVPPEVMWMNEENGLRGGREYARLAEEIGEKHIAAIESDRGGLLPIGFTSTGDEEKITKFRSWTPLFRSYGLYNFDSPGGGADIGPLSQQGTFLIGLLPDSQRYFRYHHTADDVFEAVDRRELELGAGSMAAMIYLIDKYGL